MSEHDEQAMLNPQVAEIEIGIRSLRKITVYPLSMADQLELTDLVSQALAGATGAMEDMEVVAFITNLIRENLSRILSMVTDEKGDELLKELTNYQAANMVETIYEVNYGSVAKNFKSLFGKLAKLFPLERPLPPFASDTAIDSTTSIESPGEKEA